MKLPQFAYPGIISSLEKNLDKLSQLEDSLTSIKERLYHQEVGDTDIFEISSLIKKVDSCLEEISILIDKTSKAQSTIYVNGQLGLIKLAAYTAALSSLFMLSFIIYGLLT